MHSDRRGMDTKKLLAKHLIFPIGNLRSQVSKNLKKLEKSQWFSLDEIRKSQWDKFQELLNYSYLNVPYYRRLMDDRSISPPNVQSFEDIWRIPPLSKKIIKENFDNLLAVTADKKTLIKRTTSGSTGEPVTVFRDRRADSVVSAGGWRFRRWGGHDIGDIYAKIWAQSSERGIENKFSIKSRVKQILGNLIEPVEILNTYETIIEPMMEDFLKKIKIKNIKLLVGYANSIYFFAQFVNKHHQGEIELQSVRTIAEMLHSDQRQLIEKVFGCNAFDTYGNRESGLIAAECSRHEGYHINAENLYVEILDHAGKPVPMGETGYIAITDLNNRAMPLIRYLTGDQGSLSPEPCSCGRGLPLIDKIVGRTFDMLTLSDGSLMNGYIFGGFFHKKFADKIEKFRVIQNTKGEADIYLKLSSPFGENQFEQFKKGLIQFIDNRLLLKFHVVDELPFHKGGKYKYIISNLNN